MGRAPFERKLELRRVMVDRDQRVGSREVRRGDHLQSDATAADHRALTASDAGGVADRSEPR